ncbi:MAG: 50S ribosomal protein L31 [Candidatus Levybacteria bacterium RIFCSPHIGHO2_01_FULL_37_17]|nr:MAG: 50S ribosomal protein L31 [Candidatus Levybacteria bacterium RIFCSPHIGHO2_01_FULL_37_17]OGH36840.1 MAG: 50S ribosomal protein L31 [Candidatus Levybacteria bacterium RIFCSPLOWO2_01_FULL_38_23]
MKQQIHPVYFEDAQVICACGNKFTTGSTQEVIRVELCYNCHPFYTGEQRFVDSASRIQKFQKKQEVAKLHVTKKKEIEEKKTATPKTLREMLSEIQ